MKRIINIIKTILAIVLLLLGLGYCGHMDSEYETDREMMARSQYE